MEFRALKNWGSKANVHLDGSASGHTHVFKYVGVNFINILCALLLPIFWRQKITKLCFGFEIFWPQNNGTQNVDEIDTSWITELLFKVDTKSFFGGELFD